MDEKRLEALKDALREIAADPKFFIPDQESFELLHKIVPVPATEVGIFNRKGELLLHHRHFHDWPGEFGKIHDWYIPGGYMRPGGTFQDYCSEHIKKDGVLSPIRFVGTCGAIKWMPGEHPFSNLVSIACACLLEEKGLRVKPGMEESFKFFARVVPTAVPRHTEVQEMLFRWRNAHPYLFKG